MATLLGAVVSPRRFVPDVIVRDSSPFGVRDGFVVVVTFRVASDNVPSVDQARDVTQNAEEDVDQGITRADSRLDPD